MSSAAGGVGSIAVQLAKNIGAEVIGIASESNHDWLKKHGVIPVNYDGDVKGNILAALNNRKPDAFIDTSGKGYVELAVNMGIDINRIDTIIDFEAAGKYKVKTDGSSAAANTDVLKELAKLIDEGKLEIPVAKTFPLSNVKEAFKELEQRHTRGKIILIP